MNIHPAIIVWIASSVASIAVWLRFNTLIIKKVKALGMPNGTLKIVKIDCLLYFIPIYNVMASISMIQFEDSIIENVINNLKELNKNNRNTIN